MIIEILTVLALVVGLADAVLTLGVIHRQHNDEVAERRHWELQTKLDEGQEKFDLLVRDELHELIDLIKAAPQFVEPEEEPEISPEPGNIRIDQTPSWWYER